MSSFIRVHTSHNFSASFFISSLLLLDFLIEIAPYLANFFLLWWPRRLHSLSPSGRSDVPVTRSSLQRYGPSIQKVPGRWHWRVPAGQRNKTPICEQTHVVSHLAGVCRTRWHNIILSAVSRVLREPPDSFAPELPIRLGELQTPSAITLSCWLHLYHIIEKATGALSPMVKM